MKPFVLVSASIVLCASSARSTSTELASPFRPAPAVLPVEGLSLRVPASDIGRLARQESVALLGVLLPSGRVVDLDLARIEHEPMGFAFEVDGVLAPRLLDELAFSLWKGGVRGEPDSEAALSFSRAGVRGWIRSGSDFVHVLPWTSEDGSWAAGQVAFVEQRSLARAGATFAPSCDALPLPGAPSASAAPPRAPLSTRRTGGGQAALGSGCGLRECRIAITTDFQLYTRFADALAEAAYVATTLALVSDRYEAQAGTLLTFPYVALYTTAADPWVAQDSGGDCVAVLYELQGAWGAGIPAGADLGHLISGANLGCGVAWLGGLGAPPFNLSVAGNVNGLLPFPLSQGTANWDFIVSAHELGHNFHAIHTHDYCPPADECPPSAYYGPCQTQQVCTNQGTIMSYCHLCSGGTGNVLTSFHAASAADMSAAAATYLPFYAGVRGDHPAALAPDTPTALTAEVAGAPLGPVELRWRPTPTAPFQAIAMAGQGGCAYTATLPGLGCNETPEFYYAFTDAAAGPRTDPPGAPGTCYGVTVGDVATIAYDDFEAATGWTTSVSGATSGQWERGVPVNDAGWAWDPAADGDGSGSCWLTQNAPGNTDVDGGTVHLESPPLDLSAPELVVEYEYYLRLNVSNGYDALRVEATATAAGGAWIEIARHSADFTGTWRHHAIERTELVAAGVTPGNGTRLRFSANDGDPASIVEAALDGLRIARRVCTEVGASTCTATANSTGAAATVSATGTASVGANNLALRAGPVPAATLGAFYCGTTAAPAPFGNGVRCAGAPGFFFAVRAAVGAALSEPVDLTGPPAVGQVLPGSTWCFQAWFRDVAAGAANFNLSNAYRVTFVP